MELSKQVVGLELSKRLKELGVENESLFYWTDNEIIFQEYCSHYENCISAFTASELLEMLPCEIKIGNIKYGLFIERYCDTYTSCYNTFVIDGDQVRGESLKETISKSLHESLAKMLILLIESKIIEV